MSVCLLPSTQRSTEPTESVRAEARGFPYSGLGNRYWRQLPSEITQDSQKKADTERAESQPMRRRRKSQQPAHTITDQKEHTHTEPIHPDTRKQSQPNRDIRAPRKQGGRVKALVPLTHRTAPKAHQLSWPPVSHFPPPEKLQGLWSGLRPWRRSPASPHWQTAGSL